MTPQTFFVTLKDLGFIRRLIFDTIRSEGLAIPDSDLQSVVGETVQNVVRHAYDETGGDLEVGIDDTTGGRILWFKDFGKGFDVGAIRSRFCGEVQLGESGMGLPMVALMISPFKLDIQSTPGFGTVVSIQC